VDKSIAWSLAFVCSLLLSGTTFAQTSPSKANANARSEIAIREVVLSDGERRYGVPIKVGDTAIEAGLDSGSTGLRILPGVLAEADAKGGGATDRYSYGAGTQFDGEVGTGSLVIGSLSAPSTMQLIKTVGCRSDSPHCPASRIPLSQFGIQGSGLPGEGFRAILGVNMANADVASPLSALGAKRWIIELPRPNSGTPGKIILDPSDDDVQGFTLIPVVSAFRQQKGGLHDSVPGCILNNATKEKACGALLMDTGAPGIAVNNGKLGRTPWPNGTAATLAFYGGERLAAVEQFTVGQRTHASHLSFDDTNEQSVTIYAGLSPYFAFDVLYDPGQGLVGLKPRPPATDAPTGSLAAPAD
jgi:hypothetical protein